MHDLGFKVDILPIAGSNHKFNLLATYGEGAGGLLLAGHSDTVPFDAGRWQFDPFKLTEKRDVFMGWGSADMKGFCLYCRHVARYGFKQITEAVADFGNCG